MSGRKPARRSRGLALVEAAAGLTLVISVGLTVMVLAVFAEPPIDGEDAGIVAVFYIPVLIAGLALMLDRRGFSAWSRPLAAILLAAWAVLGVTYFGLYYLPVALLMTTSALVGAHSGRHAQAETTPAGRTN